MDIYSSGLWLDLGVRGVWQSQAETLFDIKVISNCTPESVLDSGAQDKRGYTNKQSRIVEVLLHLY